MDTENNQNTSLQLLHAYDSSDSSDESNQNISEKYVNTKNSNVSKQSDGANETHKNTTLNVRDNALSSNESDLKNSANLTFENVIPQSDNAGNNVVEESKANNNGGYNSEGLNVDMAHRPVKPWIGDGSCDDDDEDDDEEDSDSSSASEWESLKGDDASSDSDENTNAQAGATYCNKKITPRVKGEMAIEDLPPIEDLTISVPNNQCVHIGSIYDIIDQLVIVKTLPDKPTLDLDTVLFLEEGARPLGQIFDVFGQVTQPFYCVRFNSNNHIKDKGVERNMMVYYAPKTEYTHLVYASDLMKAKGSDASWKDDVEIPEQLCEYSDDEEERKAKQMMREKKKKAANLNNDEGETSSGNKKPKLTPFEIKMNKINLEKTAEFNKMNNYRMLCGRGRGLLMMMMGQPNHNNMEIRSQAPVRGRVPTMYPEYQRSAPENPFENPFDIPHGFRVFPTHCPRFPPIPGTMRNPIPMNRPTFSPPPGQPFPRPPVPLFARGNLSNLGLPAPRFRNPRPGGGSYYSDDRPNF